MTEGSVLDDLRAWFEGHGNSLAGDGYQVEFAESPSDRSKLSASLTISSAQRVGRLVIWDTGEAELSMGDVASASVTEDHRKITSEIGLRDATETLLAGLSESR
jgi:hypothetical protein